MELLSPEMVYQVNCRLARELLEERLDVPVTLENIQKLANCIGELEAAYLQVSSYKIPCRETHAGSS